MGIDDIINNSNQDSDSSSSTSGGGSSGSRSFSSIANDNADRWNTKLDFSAPYVLVVEDIHGNIHKHKGGSMVLPQMDSWKRVQENFTLVCSEDECHYRNKERDKIVKHLKQEHGVDEVDDEAIKTKTEKHFDKKYRVVFKMDSHAGWVKFCSLAQDQLDVDPEQKLDDQPLELASIDERVYWPPQSKPDPSRECQVCGERSTSNEVSVMEIDLHNTRKLPVCSSHTVEELAKEGFLD